MKYLDASACPENRAASIGSLLFHVAEIEMTIEVVTKLDDDGDVRLGVEHADQEQLSWRDLVARERGDGC